jgi:hypothetical protein
MATGLLDVLVFIGYYNNRLTQWFYFACTN